MTAAPRRARLVIEFTDYWLSSTGGSGAGDLDIVAYRDSDRCPAMPMTQIKGTLRETAARIWGVDAVSRFFGAGGSTSAAQVRFAGDARLPVGQRAWFRTADGPRAALFSRLRSTMIDSAGVARTETLRTAEVAVPLTLEGVIDWVADDDPPGDWIDRLDGVCRLTFAFGHGKNDGLGRATARCLREDAPQGGAIRHDAARRRLVIDLFPEDEAVFSRQNANEGAQHTHAAPTGSALWGWAASQLYSSLKAEEAWLLFHSGLVSFSDAAPLIDVQTPAFPRPAVLLAPKQPAKGDRPVFTRTDKGEPTFDPSALCLGPAAFRGTHGEERQHKVLSPCHLSLDLGHAIQPRRAHRLRSAHENGKAKTRSLFGYEHITQPALGYRAVVEGEGVEADLWSRLAEVFTGRLFLGKARFAGYGGGYACAVGPTDTGFPAERHLTVAPGGPGDLMRIWCLADLALVDEWGSPITAPAATDLGLSAAWAPAPAESAVTTRRYAPWNRAVDGHESEIVVIEAGSVLAYRYCGDEKPAPQQMAPLHGVMRERGFGRLAVMPSALPNQEIRSAMTAPAKSDGRAPPRTDADQAVIDWATAIDRGRDTRIRDAWLAARRAALDSISGRALPARSQWSLLAEASQDGFPDAWRDAFKADYGWKGAVADWLEETTREPRPAMPDSHFRWALAQLIGHAKAKAPNHGKERA